MGDPLLEAEDLTIQYKVPDGWLTAVSNASFELSESEFFGLVGESGCGKSTIVKSIMGGLEANGRIESGSLRYKGRDIHTLSESELIDEIRWKEISWIPQGSMSSLDPLRRISNQALEIADIHTELPEDEALETFRETLEIVGISGDRMSDYPHQFSGGMKQRVLIALSLFLEPSLLIADEPTTALDVIMQDQVFKYIDEIKAASDISMILITHDISLVFETCDTISIMHAGQIAEQGTVDEVYNNPRHPYSIMLQRAFPDIRHLDRELEVIDGYPPQNIDEVDYCTFADRCPWAVEECRAGEPPLEPLAEEPSHRVGCIRKNEVLEEYRSAVGGTEGVEQS